MTSFGPDDLITKLNCGGRHFYHTSCIENWIRQGGNQCPMCREPITNDVQLQDVAQEPVAAAANN